MKRRGPGRGGMGFGFRGTSPPAPFGGRGRGELPRCYWLLYMMGQLPGMPGPVQPGQYAPPVSAPPFSTKEQELEALYQAAQDLKIEVEEIEKRIKTLEKS